LIDSIAKVDAGEAALQLAIAGAGNIRVADLLAANATRAACH